MLENWEQISVVSLIVAVAALIGGWVFIRNFRLPSDFEEKENYRRELKISLLENRSDKQSIQKGEEEDQAS
ncbi:MAG: hypothetical protein ACLFQB_01135 [Chitinispirillaceae bacterium]